ncbi:nucleotidyltransferase family protein [Fusibacter bizertensis]
MKTDKILELIEIIKSNDDLMKVFDTLDDLKLNDINLKDYYIGAGAIVQSVWNRLTGKQANYGIGDVDIVYYDLYNNTESDEKEIEQAIKDRISDLPYKIDVKNEARVHLWYRDKFGYDIDPYRSLEDAIDSWPTTSTALGIRRVNKEEWHIYAPFGLNDIFELNLRPNARQITEAIYMNKVQKWTGKWRELKYEKWTGDIIPKKYPEVIKIKI